MSNPGGQAGNKNGARGKEFRKMLQRVMHEDGRDGLREVAAKLLDSAVAGEAWAIKEIADRVDGKPKQQTEVTGAEGTPLFDGIKVQLVRADDPDT